MLRNTVDQLRCPAGQACLGELRLHVTESSGPSEVEYGRLECRKCGAEYPILAGVAVVVEAPGEYLAAHVKGVSKRVPDERIPSEMREDYLDAKQAWMDAEAEHIEEDLEADRVNALYFMNHFLTVAGADPAAPWWKPMESGDPGSSLLDELIRRHWDHGPLDWIRDWFDRQPRQARDVVELGCGVGGLSARLAAFEGSYLGVDSSFASISLARELARGEAGEVRIPSDLLTGSLARKVTPMRRPGAATHDFIVGDLENPPVARGAWDVSVILNAIDMLQDPARLPKIQAEVLRHDGIAIQACPYVWHESVVSRFRTRLPRGARDSASAVEWLYEQAGLKVREKVGHLPWLFFKHLRQLEVYSVHLFVSGRL